MEYFVNIVKINNPGMQQSARCFRGKKFFVPNSSQRGPAIFCFMEHKGPPFLAGYEFKGTYHFLVRGNKRFRCSVRR